MTLSEETKEHLLSTYPWIYSISSNDLDILFLQLSELKKDLIKQNKLNTIRSLKTGDKVRYRIGYYRPMPFNLEWEDWKEGTLFIEKRKKTIKKTAGTEWQQGAIMELRIKERNEFHFSENDYSYFDDCFVCENNYLQIDFV